MGGGSMDGEDLWMGRGGGKYMSKEKRGKDNPYLRADLFNTLSIIFFSN